MTHFPLHGRCPICSSPESAAWANDAYVGSTINESDKVVPLVWSAYYKNYVCRLCKIEGQDKIVDHVRDKKDRDGEVERQRMGYVRNYTTN